MQRSFLIGSALALSVAWTAYAQPAAPTGAPPPAATGAPAPPAPPSANVAASALKQGMVVKDTTGSTVGTISKIGQTADGQAAVMINVDGKEVGLLASNLTVDPTGTSATSAVTKAQLASPTTPSAPAGAKTPG
jgi:hypothetical protein